MAGFQTIWSLDVGKSSLKAVKMQRERNSLEILAVDKITYPVETDGVDSLQQAKQAIEVFASRNDVNCPVVVSHPGHSAFSRFIQLPPVDEKKLVEMIGYEAQQQIPFPIDEVIWDYHVSEGAGAEKEVGIFAVRREVVSDFMLDYETNGISLDMISIGYIGLLNYFKFDLRPNKPAVVLDIGSDHTDLLISDGDRIWIRTLNSIGGNDFTQALMDKFKLSYAEAEKLKIEAAKSGEAVKIFGVLQPVFQSLINEIHRSVGFYKSQAGDVTFEDLFLFGNGAKVIGMQKYLQEQLRFRVHSSKGFNRIRVNREANVALLQSEFPAFASVVGNAIQGMGEGAADVNLMPQERKEALDFKRKQKAVILAACLLFVIPVFWMMLFNGKIGSADAAQKKTKIAKELKAQAKKIDSYDKKQETLLAEAKEIAGLSAMRDTPSRIIDLIYKSFNAEALNNQVVPSKQVLVSQKASAMSELTEQVDELNRGKMWLGEITISRVYQNAEGDVFEKIDKDEDASTFTPAYRAQITGYIIQPDEAKLGAVEGDIGKRFRDPLNELLVASFGKAGFGRKAYIEAGAGRSNVATPWAKNSDLVTDGELVRLEEGDEVDTDTFYEFKFHLVVQDEALRPTAAPKAEDSEDQN